MISAIPTPASPQTRRRLWVGPPQRPALALALAATALLAFAACSSQPTSEADTSRSPSTERQTPSALDHTYHGEMMKARQRAIRTLNSVDAERKDREAQERSFDRPASPTPDQAP